MTKQTEYRAWDKKNKKMHYQDHLGWFFEGDGCFLGMAIGVHIGASEDEDDYDITEYIGIKDTINNKIFDGDVIRREFNMRMPGTHGTCRTENFWKVYWDQQSLSFKVTGVGKGGWPWPQEIMRLWNDEHYGPPTYEHNWNTNPIVTVVGNIYENPELLENKE